MKAIRGFCISVLLCLCCSVSEAAFWGSVGGGYSSDDNFYKDVFRYKNTGCYYTANLNLKNKLSPGLQYDASYLLLGRKNNDLAWEDNFLNNVRLNLLARPSDVYNVRLFTVFENKIYPDAYTKKYSYNQYRIGAEVPLYIFDFTTFKAGGMYENMDYNDFDYDSTAIGPLFELQQELSPWTKMTLAANILSRDYSRQHLYDTIVTTSAARRKDTELYTALALSAIISKSWNISTGIRYENIRSNANLSVVDPAVSVSSRTLVADYYSYAAPSVFFETVFYPARKLSCLSGVVYQEKGYTGRYAVDSAGNLLSEQRKDRKFIVTAGITYRIAEPVVLKADYVYENSSSNDYIYSYTSNMFSTGIDFFF